MDGRLLRLLQAHGDEPHRRRDLALRLEQAHGLLDFFSTERLERMTNGRGHGSLSRKEDGVRERRRSTRQPGMERTMTAEERPANRPTGRFYTASRAMSRTGRWSQALGCEQPQG